MTGSYERGHRGQAKAHRAKADAMAPGPDWETLFRIAAHYDALADLEDGRPLPTATASSPAPLYVVQMDAGVGPVHSDPLDAVTALGIARRWRARGDREVRIEALEGGRRWTVEAFVPVAAGCDDGAVCRRRIGSLNKKDGDLLGGRRRFRYGRDGRRRYKPMSSGQLVCQAGAHSASPDRQPSAQRPQAG